MFFRSLASNAAFTAVIPGILSCKVVSAAIGKDLALQGLSEKAFLWTGLGGILKRSAIYTKSLPKVGSKLTMSFGSLFSRIDIEIG